MDDFFIYLFALLLYFYDFFVTFWGINLLFRTHFCVCVCETVCDCVIETTF